PCTRSCPCSNPVVALEQRPEPQRRSPLQRRRLRSTGVRKARGVARKALLPARAWTSHRSRAEPPTRAQKRRSATRRAGHALHRSQAARCRSACSLVEDFGAVRANGREVHGVFVSWCLGDIQELELLQLRQWTDVFDLGLVDAE